MVSNKKTAAKSPDSRKKVKEKPKEEEKELKPLKNPVTSHVLVPPHRIISEGEKIELLNRYNIKLNQLPKISSQDAVVKLMPDAKPGDVVEIERPSATAGTTKYYRVILND